MGECNMIRLAEVRHENKDLLWNIHQKYLYEMTKYYPDDVDEHGNYHYGYFDAYFTESDRKAYFIYVDDKLAGFAMINTHSYIGGKPDHVLAEFCIFPSYRGRGIGMMAAGQILRMFGGRWEIKYNEKNTAAKGMWNKLTKQYNPEKYCFSDVETVLSFAIK